MERKTLFELNYLSLIWSIGQGSNLRHRIWKNRTLPTELPMQNYFLNKKSSGFLANFFDKTVRPCKISGLITPVMP
jgi:hypothetical protein